MAPWLVCSVAVVIQRSLSASGSMRAGGRCELAALEAGDDLAGQLARRRVLVGAEHRRYGGEMLAAPCVQSSRKTVSSALLPM